MPIVITPEQIEQAKKLLLETEDNIADVAQAVGISRGAFSEVFKRRVGVNPKEFRLQNRVHSARVQSILHDIEANFHDPAYRTPTSKFAQTWGIAVGSVSSMFSKETGQTIQTWLALRRIQEAKKFLADLDMTRDEVAAQSGFPNQNRMIQIFSKYTDTTPMAYRALNNKGQKDDPRSLAELERLKTAISLLFFASGNLEDISRKAGYSAYSPMHTAFKKATGLTPGALRQSQIESLKTIITRTDLPLDKISDLYGFGSNRDFIAYFFKHTGQSPNEYRMFNKADHIIRLDKG